MNSFNIFINNKKVRCDSTLSILQICELSGVIIPRFCFHPFLSVAGNCRMCLVFVEKMPKLQASCAVLVSPEMVIHTNSSIVLKAREGILEFLLINHPLDCPICDRASECDLQDQTLFYGSDRGRFRIFKRATIDKDCGPLIKTIMTRCIHCTRCVRFANEILGITDFGSSGRGNSIEIGTFIPKLISSELSGNLIDLCPVGALTSKPYSFLARSWELKHIESLDIFDCLHSNIRIDLRGYDILRILPRVNEYINDCWISDKIRFCFDALSIQRITVPLYKQNNIYKVTSWFNIINFIFDSLKKSIRANKIAFIFGYFIDLESLLLLKRIVNRINGVILDHEYNYSINSDFELSFKFNTTIKNIKFCDICLFIGINPSVEAPILSYHIRKKYLRKRIDIGFLGSNMLNLSFPYKHLGVSLNNILFFLEGKSFFCKSLRNSLKPCIVFGKTFLNSIKLIQLNLFFTLIKNKFLLNCDWNYLNLLCSGSNDFMKYYLNLCKKRHAYSPSFDILYILGDVYSYDSIFNCDFVLLQSHHGTTYTKNANIVLPVNTFFEKSKTFVNLEGQLQITSEVSAKLQQSKLDCELLSCLLYYLCINDTSSFDWLKNMMPHFFVLNKDSIYRSFFCSFCTFQTVSQFSTIYFSNSLVDNYYKSDIISKLSMNMQKCSNQILNKSPFG